MAFCFALFFFVFVIRRKFAVISLLQRQQQQQLQMRARHGYRYIDTTEIHRYNGRGREGEVQACFTWLLSVFLLFYRFSVLYSLLLAFGTNCSKNVFYNLPGNSRSLSLSLCFLWFLFLFAVCWFVFIVTHTHTHIRSTVLVGTYGLSFGKQTRRRCILWPRLGT